MEDIGLGSYHGPRLPWILQLEVPFRFGLPLGIFVELSAQTAIVSQGGSLETVADLSHTAAWGGVVELRDAVGSVLGAADYDLISASGVDYRVAVVPEVPTLPLLLSGLLVLGFRLHTLPGSWRRSIAVAADGSCRCRRPVSGPSAAPRCAPAHPTAPARRRRPRRR